MSATKPSIVLPSSPGERPAILHRPITLLWMAGIVLLCVPMATLVDVPIARWFATDPLPRELGKTLEFTEVFSHGSGVFLVLTAVVLMAPPLRWQVPRLAGLAIGGAAVAIIAKMFVIRSKPNQMNFDIATADSAWLWAFDWTLSQVALGDASSRAFPSASVATAVALTAGLCVVLPRGRWLFGCVCAGMLLQPLDSGTQFLSDVLGGVAIGLLWAYACFEPRLLGRLFDHIAADPKRRRQTGGVRETSDPPPRSRAA